MDDLKKLIKSSRNIAESTLNTYMNQVKRLIKLNGVDFSKDTSKINKDKLQKEIMKLTITSRKNLLTTLIVILSAFKKDLEPWKKLLTQEDEKYRTFLKRQTKTQTQKQNWIKIKEVTKVKNKLKTEARDIIKIADKTLKDFDILQDYYIILFLSNHHTRLDLADVHYGLNKTTDKFNWLIKNKRHWEYHLYKFKTAKFQKNLPIILRATQEENTYLNKYIKLLNLKEGDPILKNRKGKKYTRRYLGTKVTKIFKKYLRTKKNIGVNLLRHIYMSEILKTEKPIKEKEKIAEEFQHSPEMSQLYIKND